MPKPSTTSMQIAGPELVTRPLPPNCPPEDHALFSHELQKPLAPVQLTTLSQCTVYPNGFVAAGHGFLPAAAGFSHPRKGLSLNLKDAVRLGLQRVSNHRADHIEHAIMPVDEHGNGFFHWLCDSLPRLELLAASGYDLSARTILIPSMAVFPYVMPSLETFGPGKIVCGKRTEAWQVGTLELVSPVAPTGNYRPWVMERLRTRMVTWFQTTEKASLLPRRIFISRARAPRRKIMDESALDPLLTRLGVEKVFLEELDFASQVRLCAQAELIVGLHGAGLSNILWAPPTCKVVEIRFRGDSHNNCYFSLAAAMGQKYSYVLAEKTDPAMDVHDADAVVDPRALERALAQ